MISCKNVSTHIEDLNDGRVLAVGDIAHNVDEKHPHNARLLEERKLIPIQPDKKSTGTSGAGSKNGGK